MSWACQLSDTFQKKDNRNKSLNTWGSKQLTRFGSPSEMATCKHPSWLVYRKGSGQDMMNKQGFTR